MKVDVAFEIAGGSVTGSTHVRARRKNQDAFAWARVGAGLVAVVCDGCSGSPASDVGASIAARLIVRSAATRMGTAMPPGALLAQVAEDVISHLRSLAEAMSTDGRGDGGPGEVTRYRRTVADYLLFTTVGVLVDHDVATTFSLGDGLVIVNGERTQLGPFTGNEPPYLGYALLDDVHAPRTFELGRTIPASAVDSLLIGTDGVLDLEALADRPIGDDGSTVGPLRQFWEEDRFYRNPDMVRRRLLLIGRDAAGGDGSRGAHAGGLLPDDTTLVALRPRAGRAR